MEYAQIVYSAGYSLTALLFAMLSATALAERKSGFGALIGIAALAQVAAMLAAANFGAGLAP